MDSPGLEFEDDGYFWILYPFFDELFDKTGQHIDLYGDAEFYGDNLVELQEMVRRARTFVDNLDSKLEVTSVSATLIGGRLEHPTIQKSKLVKLLNRFRDVVLFAIDNNCRVVCFGD